MLKLMDYFLGGLTPFTGKIGSEVETSFLCDGEPATIEQSQAVFRTLVKSGWQVQKQKGALITEMKKLISLEHILLAGHLL